MDHSHYNYLRNGKRQRSGTLLRGRRKMALFPHCILELFHRGGGLGGIFMRTRVSGAQWGEVIGHQGNVRTFSSTVRRAIVSKWQQPLISIFISSFIFTSSFWYLKSRWPPSINYLFIYGLHRCNIIICNASHSLRFLVWSLGRGIQTRIDEGLCFLWHTCPLWSVMCH